MNQILESQQFQDFLLCHTRKNVNKERQNQGFRAYN